MQQCQNLGASWLNSKCLYHSVGFRLSIHNLVIAYPFFFPFFRFHSLCTEIFSLAGQLGGSEETDGPLSEDIQTSLEVGLLGHVRKVLMLMPDSLAHMVVGEVVLHFSLIAMARNKDIVVRTAAIRVSLCTSYQNTH